MPFEKKLYLLLAALIFAFPFCGRAQWMENSSEQYVGEIGAAIGSAEYFGDLNTTSSLDAMKPSFGVFYRKFYNNYIGFSAHFDYAQLGYSDVRSKNQYQQTRNLSFNTSIYELTVRADFNFFRFEPGSYDYRFTPYVTVGIGGFLFDPYAYYQDQKYYLQPLGTEGQGSPLYPKRKPYGLQSICVPVGIGVKYNLTSRYNLGFEVVHRFTNTDYLDDVSTTYAGPAAFPRSENGDPTIAYILQDRSTEKGTPIGIAGRQRGNSANKDQFVMIQFTISYLLTKYRCPQF